MGFNWGFKGLNTVHGFVDYILGRSVVPSGPAFRQ